MDGQLLGTDVIEEVSDDDTSEDEQFCYLVSQPAPICPPPDSSYSNYRHNKFGEIATKYLCCSRRC